MTETRLRHSAEDIYAAELAALRQGDDRLRPANWALSPHAAVDYIMGGTAKDGTPISAKYVGNRRLIETAVATLATDRALLLLGLPGTAKSWVSEHLAAAISGTSNRVIQCTAGTDEHQIRYGWNYAMLLAKGPSHEALVRTPLMRAMEDGTLVRLEELTRMGSDVQDTLITVLSEKMMPIPELDDAIHARAGRCGSSTGRSRMRSRPATGPTSPIPTAPRLTGPTRSTGSPRSVAMPTARRGGTPWSNAPAPAPRSSPRSRRQ